MPFDFDDSGKPVELPAGIRLSVPGFSGTVSSSDEGTGGRRGLRELVAEPVLADHPELERAISRNELAEAAQLEIQLDPASVQRGTATRAATPSDLQIEVPASEGSVQVLLVEQDGVLSWHFSGRSTSGAATTRGAGAVDVFVVPNEIGYVPAESKEEQRRGIVGAIGKKILKIFAFRITDPIVGNISQHLAEEFETKHRPYGLRMITPANYDKPESDEQKWPVDWGLISSGKALLLVHGTFSTAHGAFGGLDQATIEKLTKQYEGRVFAFNHFTMSDDPRANVDWFMQQLRAGIPAGRTLTLDVLCHSRGGLVARTLAEEAQGAAGAPMVTVEKIVMVGVPNLGTALADPDHMADFIDRITNALGIVEAASGPLALIGEFLDGALTIVKILGHGALKALSGLASMDPDGPFVTAINKHAVKSDAYYAVTADFEPPEGNFRESLKTKAQNVVMDAIFRQPNDLIVPTDGVYKLNVGTAFPIPSERLVNFPSSRGVMHTTYFADADTRSHVSEWLRGAK